MEGLAAIPGTPAKESPIDMSLSRIDGRLNELEAALHNLQDRLSSVLLPAIETPKTSDEDKSPSISTLEIRLIAIDYAIDSSTEFISQLRERLQI